MTRKPASDPFSPVFGRGAYPRVRQPSSPWTVVLGACGAGVLGLFVFSSLSAGRAANAETPPLRGTQVAHAPAPPMVLASNTQTSPLPQAAPPSGAPALPSPAPAVDNNLRAPAVVVDLGGPPGEGARMKDGPPSSPEDAKSSSDERFAQRVTATSAETAHATQLHDVSHLVPQGTMVPAVLETAIDSDLPGSVRAMVSRDVRGFDGAQVLIPRGSKLIGQYKSAAAVGQTRAFVVWSRLITPTGVSVEIGSPATDRLGRGGLDGETDSHFFRRFGASILLSVVSAGLDALAHGSAHNNTAVIIGSPVQASHIADIALQKQIDIPTTIRVAPGAPVQVFVTRDLDFSTVSSAIR